MSYKISIVIPIFNVAEKLERSFKSILNQTFGFENLEVIYVDDCSTDNSAEIIKEFSNSYSNVKSIILDENSGYAGKPRNIGIEHATSDYLMFLDPDDIFLENACETLYDNIANTDLDMVSCNFLTSSTNNEYKINWNKINLEDGFLQIDSIYKQPELFLLPPSVWSKIFKKEFILNNNIIFPVGIPGQDVVFVYHALLKADGIKYVDIPIVKYMPGVDETENKSVTSTRTKNTLLGLLKAYYYALDLFKEHDDLKGYAAIHMNFWVKQLVISKISFKDKVKLLRYAYPIFEIFKNVGTLHIRGGFGHLFHKVYEKDFIGAAKLSQLSAIGLDENYYNVYNEIKTRVVFLLFDDYKYMANYDIRIVELLNNEGYDVKFINLDSIYNFNENTDVNDVLKINIYDYYSRKFTINDNYDEIDIESIESDLLIKKETLQNNRIILEYYDCNILEECSSSNIIKKELYISNCLAMIVYYKNGKIINKKYFTPDGFNYLEINNNIKLKDRFDKLFINFNDLNELYSFFIEELSLHLDKKPFLIDCCIDEFDFECVNDLTAYKIEGESLNLLDAEEVNATFRDEYIKEVQNIQSIPLENKKLHNQNIQLKKQIENLKSDLKNSNMKLKKEKENNKQLNDKLNNLLTSKSWKITKPLRKLFNLSK